MLRPINLAAALVCLLALPAAAQTNLAILYNAADTAYKAGDFAGVISNLDREIPLDPSPDVSYCLRGMAKFKLRDYNAAVLDFTKAIERKPACAGYFGRRGQARFYLGEILATQADYDKALALDPTLAIVYFNRGQLRACRQQDFKGAISDYTKAITLHNDPQEADIYFARAEAEMKIKDYRAAMADFSKTLDLQPAFACARTNLNTAQKLLREPGATIKP